MNKSVVVVILKCLEYFIVPLVNLFLIKCATLPQTTWYNQHEHPFTLCYTPEDNSGEYYYDIYEEERDPKQWFYYYKDCNFPAHRGCIPGNTPNVK